MRCSAARTATRSKGRLWKICHRIWRQNCHQIQWQWVESATGFRGRSAKNLPPDSVALSRYLVGGVSLHTRS